MLLLEKVWVTSHPQCTACKIFLWGSTVCSHPQHTTHLVPHLKCGCAHLPDILPGIAQLCLSTKTKPLLGEHLWRSFIDKAIKCHGGGTKSEPVMSMYLEVPVISHLQHLAKVYWSTNIAGISTQLWLTLPYVLLNILIFEKREIFINKLKKKYICCFCFPWTLNFGEYTNICKLK